MPGRTIPLVTNQVYHVFNRGIDHRPTFLNDREFGRAIEVITFYRFVKIPVKFSVFHIWSKENREKFLTESNKSGAKLVEIISYCLMPNHFHLLIKQKTDNGIAKFISNFLNSYTRYFNTKHKRTGPLFLDQFKALRIETEEQLLHVSRYINLNPYSSYIVKTFKDLEKYKWSSLPELLGLQKGICQPQEILSRFKDISGFKKFIFNQSDYQRNLERIKHLVFEKNS